MHKSQKIEYLENILTSTKLLVNYKLNNNISNKRIEFYTLKQDIDNFLNRKSNERLFIMPGHRGLGKTTILLQLYEYLTNDWNLDENRILYLDLNQLKNFGQFDILEYIDLFIKDINEESYLNRNPLFIFVDESQYAKNWDLVGKIIYDEHLHVFMIFAGSNALIQGYSDETSRRSFKTRIYPLNFSEYLNLKYKYPLQNNLNKNFKELIFLGTIENISKIENNPYLDLKKDIWKEWEEYIQFGNFPQTINIKNKLKIIETTLNIKDEVIEKDLRVVNSFNTKNQLKAYSLLSFLALWNSSRVSINKLANTLDCSEGTVKSFLESFKKNHTLIEIKPYGNIFKHTTNPSEYYFLSTQMKACINLSNHRVSNYNAYLTVLLKNMIVSRLFRLKKDTRLDFRLFHDYRKNGVDFIINTLLGENIPISVGINKTNIKQLKSAINYFDANYGIIISNKTSKIVKDDNVIFIPPVTFSLF